MGLKLKELQAGTKPVVDVPVDSLSDTIKVRLLTREELHSIYPPNETDDDLTDDELEERDRVRMCKLFAQTLTDDDETVLTEKDVEKMIQANPELVTVEIGQAVMNAQNGVKHTPGEH